MNRSSLAVAAVMLLASCKDQSAPIAQQQTPQSQTHVVADFRLTDSGPKSLTNPAIAQGIIESVFGSPAPNDVWLADEAAGSFTQPEQSQRLYLLARGTPTVPNQSSSRPILAVFEKADVVAQFVPPKIAYQGLPATLDINGDGMDDVVATATVYHMGQTTIRADVLSFSGGQRTLLQSLGTVYENSCDAPHADGTVRGAVLSQTQSGALATSHFTAPCPSPGRDLQMQDFTLSSSD